MSGPSGRGRGYALAYRLGLTPWERYVDAASESVQAVLERESAGRPRPPGRALDLGCGRGRWTAELVRHGWDAVGVDVVPRAVGEARRRVPGATFVVGDVTGLERAGLGTFDLLLDVGCFQGLRPEQRLAEARGLWALAAPGATLLLMAFQRTHWSAVVEGVSREDVLGAFAGWEVLGVELADTRGLGWPMNRTAPLWYRLRR